METGVVNSALDYLTNEEIGCATTTLINGFCNFSLGRELDRQVNEAALFEEPYMDGRVYVYLLPTYITSVVRIVEPPVKTTLF